MRYRTTMVDGEIFYVDSELNQREFTVMIAKLSDDSFIKISPTIMIRAKYISHIKLIED